MNLKANITIKEHLKQLQDNMIDYARSGDVDYTKDDVKKCMRILDVFLEEIGNSDSKKTGLEIVKKTVLALNDLNEACDEELIETSEREHIVEVIMLAGHLKNYNDLDDDITEDWREW